LTFKGQKKKFVPRNDKTEECCSELGNKFFLTFEGQKKKFVPRNHIREGKLLEMILLLCPKTVEGGKKEA
jgi:hypothetical protein